MKKNELALKSNQHILNQFNLFPRVSSDIQIANMHSMLRIDLTFPR